MAHPLFFESVDPIDKKVVRVQAQAGEVDDDLRAIGKQEAILQPQRTTVKATKVM